MSSNRRQHTRNLKALEFSCFIDGQRFDARSLDVSVGGAFMETEALVPMGSVALISLKKPAEEQPGNDLQIHPPRRKDFPIVLLGLVVRQQSAPVSGMGLQWLRCVSRVGLQPMYDFMGFVLDLFPSALPLPSSTVATLDFVEFDFILQTFRAGRSEDRTWDSSSGRHANQKRRRAPLQATSRSATVFGETQSGGKDPEQKPEKRPEKEPEKSAQNKPWPQARPNLPPQNREVEEPDFSLPALEAKPSRPADSRKGDLTQLLEGSRELIYRPTTVEVQVRGTRIRGVVHSLGRRHLLMATPGSEVASGTELRVRFPIPLKGRKVIIDLHCEVGAANPMEGRDAVAYDLTIRAIGNEPAAGLWERWVQFLLERRAFIS